MMPPALVQGRQGQLQVDGLTGIDHPVEQTCTALEYQRAGRIPKEEISVDAGIAAGAEPPRADARVPAGNVHSAPAVHRLLAPSRHAGAGLES